MTETEIDEWPEYIPELFEFLEKNVEGFSTIMMSGYFDLSYENLDDPLFNMTWGENPNYGSEVDALSRFCKRIDTLLNKFQGKLGPSNDELCAQLQATKSMAKASIELNNKYFNHEKRGGTNWHARLVADICFKAMAKSGATPTLGTTYDDDHPTGIYGKLVQNALIALDFNSHWNSPAIWAVKRNTKKS